MIMRMGLKPEKGVRARRNPTLYRGKAARRLMEFPTDQSYIRHDPDMADVSHETLYHHVYRDKEAGATFKATCASRPTPTVINDLRERRGMFKNQVMIDERAPIVEERSA